MSKRDSEVLRVVELVAKEQSECRREGYRWACLDLRDRVGDKAAALKLIAEGVRRFSQEGEP
jgi:hypothetical protein